MKKYMVLYHAPPSFNEKMAGMKPEEMMEEMGKWKVWMEGIGDAMLDFGNPLFGGQTVTKSGNENSTREVSGYSMIQAESMDTAMKLLNGHPHLAMDDSCSIEIHEAAPAPGQ